MFLNHKKYEDCHVFFRRFLNIFTRQTEKKKSLVYLLFQFTTYVKTFVQFKDICIYWTLWHLFLLWCLFMLVMTWWQPCCSLVYLLLLFVSTIVIPFAASCLTNCFFIELNFDRCRFSLLSQRGFSLNVVSVVVAAVPNSGTLTCI